MPLGLIPTQRLIRPHDATYTRRQEIAWFDLNTYSRKSQEQALTGDLSSACYVTDLGQYVINDEVNQFEFWTPDGTQQRIVTFSGATPPGGRTRDVEGIDYLGRFGGKTRLFVWNESGGTAGTEPWYEYCEISDAATSLGAGDFFQPVDAGYLAADQEETIAVWIDPDTAEVWLFQLDGAAGAGNKMRRVIDPFGANPDQRITVWWDNGDVFPAGAGGFADMWIDPGTLSGGRCFFVYSSANRIVYQMRFDPGTESGELSSYDPGLINAKWEALAGCTTGAFKGQFLIGAELGSDAIELHHYLDTPVASTSVSSHEATQSVGVAVTSSHESASSTVAAASTSSHEGVAGLQAPATSSHAAGATPAAARRSSHAAAAAIAAAATSSHAALQSAKRALASSHAALQGVRRAVVSCHEGFGDVYRFALRIEIELQRTARRGIEVVRVVRVEVDQ